MCSSPLCSIDWEDASRCSFFSKSLTPHQLGATTVVHLCTTHLSSSEYSLCVCVCARVRESACMCVCFTHTHLSVSKRMRMKGWHPLLTGVHRVPSTSQLRQCLTSVGIGHTRLNNNLPGPFTPSSYSPSCLFHSLLLSHCYIVSFSGCWLSRCSKGQ